MRMSFSRLAAFFVALAAGVTLASCASSSAPIAASGPNQQVNSFPAARVRFIQGSPNLNLGITLVDLYIDGKFAGTFNYPCAGCQLSTSVSGDLYSLPPGAHDFKLVQSGTLFPVFLEATLTLAPGVKYAVVASGDAGYHTTRLALFIEPKYNTSNGAVAASFFNASPKAGTSSIWYNCMAPSTACPTDAAPNLSVGTSAAPPASWKNNVILTPTTTGNYCFGAYNGALQVPSLNAPGASLPLGNNPQTAQCVSSLSLAGGTDINIYLIDQASVPPTAPGPSTFVYIFDQNG